jgi:energy-coupling factor transporter ATP-binding protein EcfA2
VTNPVTHTSSTTQHPRLLSFTLDGWDVLGDRVSVTLSDGVAVLVGRNGAGKSAILEGFKSIAVCVTNGFNQVPKNYENDIPKILEITISTPELRLLRFRYEIITILDRNPVLTDQNFDGSSSENRYSCNEDCRYIDREQEVVWSTERGVTVLSNDESTEIFTIIGSANLLFQKSIFENNSRIVIPDEVTWVHTVLTRVRISGNDKVRSTSRRSPSLLRMSNSNIPFGYSFDLANSITHGILRTIEIDRDEFDELESICKRIGLAKKITVEKFFTRDDTRENSVDRNDSYIASVLLDSVNIGLLSDGTLRVLSILLALIISIPSMTIMIEEPEMQIHPGLLEKLLNEIESYTFEENLILSTHSPQVVAWTTPDKINLVHRSDGKTIVRRLGEDEMQNVISYLSEEGSLGEWLYSGIVDE